jgi:mono/diheme cytochrome c family protein
MIRTSRRLRLTGWLLLALAVGFLVFMLWAHRPAIAAVEPVDPARFAPGEVARGAALARIGNCLSCHQSAHGRPYAGGYGVRSPFGTIYGSNITPDPTTGIGHWSEPAFVRALREGVSRDGHHLYPALPYDHFTRASDRDLRALYAFLMTRPAVRSTPPANELIPPLGFRPFIAGWKLLFFRPAPFQAPAGLPASLARGAYLSETLAHCSGCHSPRGLLGNEQTNRPYQGGWSDGWYAPPLDRHSPAVRAWTADRLYAYLTTGLDVHHAAAAGPMGDVTRSLAKAPPEDVRAIAAYYAWWMRQAPATRAEPPLPDRAAAAARAFPEGARLFAGACAACHEPGAPMMVAGRPALPLGTPLHEDDPRDLIAIILRGLEPPVGAAGPFMPAYADAMSDRQVAQIAGYLRTRHGAGPAWTDLDRQVAKARKATPP